ncbi:MAG TPA: SRPBCC family protein [Streptosporangiaceae bacterium]|jgi:hypothetical protein
MSAEDGQPVSVSRRIEVPAEELFAVLADPARHPGIDGSGMLREAGGNPVISGVGDTFTVRMNNAEMGGYEMLNHVVEFEPARRIGWEPVLAAASREEDQDDIGHRSGHRWSYELTPVGDGATMVTETYDCTRAPERLRKAVRYGERWVASMSATLEKLDQQYGRG